LSGVVGVVADVMATLEVLIFAEFVFVNWLVKEQFPECVKPVGKIMFIKYD